MSALFEALDDPTRDRLVPGPVPDRPQPMLATLVDEPFSDPDWIFERKLDGERCLALRDGSEPRLLSRNGEELADTYPELIEPLRGGASDRFVVDGEVVAFQEGVTSFSRLQQRMQIRDPAQARASRVAVFFYLFDLLHLDGMDTTRIPLRDRKRLLKRLLSYRRPLRYTTHRNRDGEAFFREACTRGWEGLIAKDATAGYVPSRSRKWQKFKCVHRQEFVVGGFTDPEGSRVGFGAILLGYHEKGRLRYAGKLGTGFDDRTLHRLRHQMEEMEQDDPPFTDDELPNRGVHWIAPRLVADVGFTEWTDGGKLRHPRYLGLRRDKDARAVVREMPS